MAIDEFKKAISLNPGYANAYNNLGSAYQALGKLDMTIDDYKKALTINPTDPKVSHNLNVAYNMSNYIKVNFVIQIIIQIFIQMFTM